MSIDPPLVPPAQPAQTKEHLMRVEPQVLPTLEGAIDQAVDVIAARISDHGYNTPFLLGCPSGRTPTPIYQGLTERVHTGSLDVSNVIIVMMDDYLVGGTEGSFVRVDPELSYSCEGFAYRSIVDPMTDAARELGRTGPREVWMPEPSDLAGYDSRIEAAGGVNLFILASGASDGHIAFNQPGTPRDTATHIATLGAATRADNMGTFPEFTDLDMVPTHGVSVGVSTIAELSHEVIMVVTGAHKRQAFHRLEHANDYQPDWPATILSECAKATFLADAAAAHN